MHPNSGPSHKLLVRGMHMRARAFTKDRDLFRIATETRDVSLHPFQCRGLILESTVALKSKFVPCEEAGRPKG